MKLNEKRKEGDLFDVVMYPIVPIEMITPPFVSLSLSFSSPIRWFLTLQDLWILPTGRKLKGKKPLLGVVAPYKDRAICSIQTYGTEIMSVCGLDLLQLN